MPFFHVTQMASPPQSWAFPRPPNETEEIDCLVLLAAQDRHSEQREERQLEVTFQSNRQLIHTLHDGECRNGLHGGVLLVWCCWRWWRSWSWRFEGMVSAVKWNGKIIEGGKTWRSQSSLDERMEHVVEEY